MKRTFLSLLVLFVSVAGLEAQKTQNLHWTGKKTNTIK